MIRKLAILAVIPLMLTACQTTDKTQVLTKTEFVATTLPKSLDNCPVMKKFPNVETLTDGQVANVLITLNSNNRKCRNSIDAIYSYHDKVTKDIESKKAP